MQIVMTPRANCFAVVGHVFSPPRGALQSLATTWHYAIEWNYRREMEHEFIYTHQDHPLCYRPQNAA
jgi:hypothetical protein